MLKFAATLALILLALPAAAHDYTVGTISIGHIWAAESTPQAKNGVAYVPLKNNGKEADVLKGADSPGAEKVEFHQTTIEDGVAKMRPLNGVALAPGEEVDLKPGGKHIMLIGLKKQLLDGEKLPITLHFEKAGDITVEAHIQKKATTPVSTHEHNH